MTFFLLEVSLPSVFDLRFFPEGLVTSFEVFSRKPPLMGLVFIRKTEASRTTLLYRVLKEPRMPPSRPTRRPVEAMSLHEVCAWSTFAPKGSQSRGSVLRFLRPHPKVKAEAVPPEGDAVGVNE